MNRFLKAADLTSKRSEKGLLCGITPEELSAIIGKHGFRSDHARKIVTAFYRNRQFNTYNVRDIPTTLKEYLRSEFVPGLLTTIERKISSDSSEKFLFRSDRGIYFESVYIPEGNRHTLCISSQSGCRMGCPFCLTAKYGYRGNLTAGEMIAQIPGSGHQDSITHVVFMGMGEPMDNLSEVKKACRILTSEWGLSLSPGRVTVSTVGITPAIKEFLASTKCSLTVSLFSPFTDERLKVVPTEKIYPVKEIIDIMKSVPESGRRRMSLAYIMIRDLNDTDAHLEELKKLLKGSSVRVNIMPYHNTGFDSLEASTSERMTIFRHELMIYGISASVRKSRGADISAACGLLAAGLPGN